MKKILTIFVVAIFSMSMTGCFSGRTNVVASSYSSEPYDIYLNGKLLCSLGDDEECTFQTRGTRAGGRLEARLNDQKVGSIRIHRSITPLTVLWTFIFIPSIWLYQAYPDEIEIPIDKRDLQRAKMGKAEFGSSTTSESVWDKPAATPSYEEQETPKEPEQKAPSVWD